MIEDSFAKKGAKINIHATGWYFSGQESRVKPVNPESGEVRRSLTKKWQYTHVVMSDRPATL